MRTDSNEPSSAAIPEPWAAGRQSIFESLAADPDAALPDVALWTWLEGNERPIDRQLNELASDANIFRELVQPRVSSIPEKTGLVEVIRPLLSEMQNAMPGAATQLYQLLLSTDRYPFVVWPALHALFSEQAMRSDPALGRLFAHWLVRAPDREVVAFALFALARSEHAPPLQVLEVLGVNSRLAVRAANVMARHYPWAEDSVMALVRRHGHYIRARVLETLAEVSSPAHREWLLDVGYQSPDYASCAYEAAVKGRLFDAMQANADVPDKIDSYVKVLTAMANAWMVSDGSPALDLYLDGPAAIALVIRHVEKHGLHRNLRENLMSILYCLAINPDEQVGIWEAAQRAQLARELRAVLAGAGADDAAPFWWEQPEPTLSNLEAGDLNVLDRVVESAKDNDDTLRGVVDWAERLLDLHGEPQSRAERRAQLLELEMPGVRSGGLAAFEDLKLSSIYGQVLLQVLLALRGTTRMGERLVQAGLEEDMPHVSTIAGEIADSWKLRDIAGA